MPRTNPSLSLHEQHHFLRIAAVSPELKLGNVAANVEIIRSQIQTLAAEGCRLIVFPELCLTGYSCADLFYQHSLQQQALEGVKQLAEASADQGCCIVVGLPLALQGRLYNVAAVIADGEVLGYVPKTFLPNSG